MSQSQFLMSPVHAKMNCIQLITIWHHPKSRPKLPHQTSLVMIPVISYLPAVGKRNANALMAQSLTVRKIHCRIHRQYGHKTKLWQYSMWTKIKPTHQYRPKIPMEASHFCTNTVPLKSKIISSLLVDVATNGVALVQMLNSGFS